MALDATAVWRTARLATLSITDEVSTNAKAGAEIDTIKLVRKLDPESVIRPSRFFQLLELGS